MLMCDRCQGGDGAYVVDLELCIQGLDCRNLLTATLCDRCIGQLQRALNDPTHPENDPNRGMQRGLLPCFMAKKPLPDLRV